MPNTRPVVGLYYLYKATNSAGFYVPVAILYLEAQGFALAFVGYAYAVYAVTTVAAEIPTGYLGDWLGRRASLAVGAGLRVVALGGYVVADAAVAYLALHVVWAVGRTFKSGTTAAWLYELLDRVGDADEYARVESRGSTVLLVTSAVTAVGGGVLYGLDPSWPFLANAVLAGLGLPVLAIVPFVADGTGTRAGELPTSDGDRVAGDDNTGAEVDDPPTSTTFTVGDAVRVLRAQVRRPAVRWLVVYLAVFYALFGVTRIYEQPALDAVGVSVTSLGVLYAAFKLVSAGAAASVGWLDEHLGIRRILALLIPIYGVVYASVAVIPALVVPALFVNRGLRVVTTPLRNQYLNDRLADVGRATVLSGAAMAMALASAGARIVAATVVGVIGPVGLLPVGGVVAAVLGAAVWIWTRPVRVGAADATSGGGDAAVAD